VRLVVADDSAIVRDGLRHLLEAHGHEIAATAADGDELVAAVERTRPDVALIDIRMPPTHTTEGSPPPRRSASAPRRSACSSCPSTSTPTTR
jgi:DNA-binding NarL/FixJ family response regulator